MRISPKKKGEIYNAVHEAITDLRIDLRLHYLTPDDPQNNIVSHKLRDKIDFIIGQVEVPLAQKLIALVKGNTKNED